MNTEPNQKEVELQDEDSVEPGDPSWVHPDDDAQATQWMRDAMDCVPYT